jgi:pimeloyl-ACP methyl ester carboxylesterase
VTSLQRGLARTSFGQIHYRESGAGPAIVLLHINQQSSAMHLELIEALAPRMRAIAIDYPSHGGSDHVAEQPTLPDYARCVVEVMDALGVREWTALGEATGAAVSVALADLYPDRVGRIVLVNCPFFESTVTDAYVEDFKKYRPGDGSGFPALRTLEFMRDEDPDHAPLHPTQSWMDRINRAQVEAGRERWQALTALVRYDLGSALERLRCPVLMLTGEHFYFRHKLPEFQSRVRNLRCEVLAGARFCAGWERADEIAGYATGFANEGTRS